MCKSYDDIKRIIGLCIDFHVWLESEEGRQWLESEEYQKWIKENLGAIASWLENNKHEYLK